MTYAERQKAENQVIGAAAEPERLHLPSATEKAR